MAFLLVKKQKGDRFLLLLHLWIDGRWLTSVYCFQLFISFLEVSQDGSETTVCVMSFMDLLFYVAEAVLLGFQHYLVMLGTTVLIPASLVPQMGGGNVRLWLLLQLFEMMLPLFDTTTLLKLKVKAFLQEEKAKMIQTILFVAGLNTLFQTLFGTRLPAVIGASYTFVPTTISIILAGRYSNILNPQEVVNWK